MALLCRPCCKLCAFILLAYVFAHLLFTAYDLDWMPPGPDLAFATDPPHKRTRPDGPLVLKEGILAQQSDAQLSKAVLLGPSEQSFDVQISEQSQSPKMRQKLKISERFLEKFRRAARELHKKSAQKFVLFTVANHAYLELTLNWLCNIYALAERKELVRAVLIVALDKRICAELRKEWPEVTCLVLLETGNGAQKMLSVEQKAYNEPLGWGRLRYVQILRARANLMAAMAEMKVPFVLVESDAVWLRNPMALFANATLVDDADVVMPLNSEKGSIRGRTFAFDPLVAFPTKGTRRLMQELRRRMNDDQTAMDQDILNELCSSQYAGVVCREFAQSDIADGAWFKLSEAERKRSAQRERHWPLVVNNNFYVGVHNKMARQAINGLWFLTAKKRQCNLSKAKHTLEKYSKV